ncbi:phytoene/squalene synthase family protein [Luteolibacter marinus]|uniref:phytoene/squalene synthase family protein n=1 Tax=Luteolibacter marinus TaxID=2776705 RepID=UPI0031BAA383
MLRSVSRSFFVSLRLLPKRMRPAISTGYLLARASDTLADTAGVAVDDRLELLDGFNGELAGKGARWRERGLDAFIGAQQHEGEKALLTRLDECFAALEDLDALQADAVRNTVTTIISGQRMDLVRFEEATAADPRALRNEGELEDYCYRVAGCVGGFWTRIGLLTLGSRFSDAPPDDLDALGVRYGMGLQLVNILRDLPADLANGRCYLPVGNPRDSTEMAGCHRAWREHAAVWLESGRRYSSRLKVRRLRAASVLPALIGEDTLELIAAAGFPLPEHPVKVGRGAVRRALWRAWWWPGGAQATSGR